MNAADETNADTRRETDGLRAALDTRRRERPFEFEAPAVPPAYDGGRLPSAADCTEYTAEQLAESVNHYARRDDVLIALVEALERAFDVYGDGARPSLCYALDRLASPVGGARAHDVPAAILDAFREADALDRITARRPSGETVSVGEACRPASRAATFALPWAQKKTRRLVKAYSAAKRRAVVFESSTG